MIAVNNKIKEYIRLGLIDFVTSETREEVIEQLISLTQQEGILRNRDEFYQAIIQREEMVSTGLGMGIAIPHAKIKELDDFFVVVGIHRGPGIEWNAIDGLKVKLIFLIGGPQSMHKEYLQLLSELTQVLKLEENRQKILRAKSQESVVNIFHSC